MFFLTSDSVVILNGAYVSMLITNNLLLVYCRKLPVFFFVNRKRRKKWMTIVPLYNFVYQLTEQFKIFFF